MKILIISALAVICTVAEPPVDNKYLPPNRGSSFSSPSTSYGAPGISQRKNTEVSFRPNSQGSSYTPRTASRRPSSQYGAPGLRGQQNQFSAPSALYSAPSNQYSAPTSQYSAPSSQYSAPSSQYSAPSSKYSAPSSQYSAPSSQYSAPSSQYSAPASQYSAPSSQYSAPTSQYSAPSSQYSAPSTSYGTPSAQARQPSSSYGAPSQRGFQSRSSGYEAPSAPSQQYGAPGFGNEGAQSRQYLPPGTNGIAGYGGDDENSEPANYSFEYMVKDDASGNDFGHRESRQGDRAEGLYYVLLPDGRKQTVEYEADANGYKPRISYEDTGLGQGGYDRNAQDQGYQGGY